MSNYRIDGSINLGTGLTGLDSATGNGYLTYTVYSTTGSTRTTIVATTNAKTLEVANGFYVVAGGIEVPYGATCFVVWANSNTGDLYGSVPTQWDQQLSDLLNASSEGSIGSLSGQTYRIDPNIMVGITGLDNITGNGNLQYSVVSVSLVGSTPTKTIITAPTNSSILEVVPGFYEVTSGVLVPYGTTYFILWTNSSAGTFYGVSPSQYNDQAADVLSQVETLGSGGTTTDNEVTTTYVEPIMSVAITRDQLFRERVQQILGTMQAQYPTLFVQVELYRLNVVNFPADESIDDQPEVFIRLDQGPNVTAFNYQTMDRWYQADVGLVQMKVNNLIVPGEYDLQPDDHVIIGGVAYMVVDAQNIMGVCKAKIDLPKARWVKPPRGTPTYRQFLIQAYIQ